MIFKKLLDANNPENTIMHIVMRDEKTGNTEYKCVGVLMEENENIIRVAFNAKNDVVVDDLTIKRENIVSIEVLDPATIENL
jgi:hypothetical protein